MNKRLLQSGLKILQILGDAAVISCALLLAYYVRFYAGIVPVKYGIPEIKYYIYAVPFVLFVFLLSMNYAGLYRETRKLEGPDEALNVIIAVTAGTVVILASSFFVRHFTYSRVVMGFMWVLCIVFIALWRLVYRWFFRFLSRREIIVQKIAVAGATEISKILIDRLKRMPGSGYRIVGVLDNRIKKGRRFEGVPVLGSIRDVSKAVKKYKIDEIFIGLNNYNRKEIAEIIMENEKIKFMIASDVLNLITKSIDYDQIFGIPVFAVKELPLNKMRNRFIKRTFDIISSAAGLVLLFPLFLVVAIVIKAESKGPVFYRQERVGRDNKIFIIYKFRTMKTDAEKESGPVWAKESDQRRTKAGAILRKTSIDELPQLINIFKGEMSVVGPRPERPHFVNKFKKTIPRYVERHRVKSGLTGWAQVHGLRGNTSLEERVKYDLYYIENWSLLMELKIIIKTALEVFHHTTAY